MKYEIPLRPSLSPSPYAVSWRETSSRVNTQLTPLCDGMKPVTFGTPFLSTHAWKYKSRLVCVRAYVCVHACIACRGTRARACMCVQSREVQKEEQLDDLPPKGHRQSDEHWTVSTATAGKLRQDGAHNYELFCAVDTVNCAVSFGL